MRGYLYFLILVAILLVLLGSYLVYYGLFFTKSPSSTLLPDVSKGVTTTATSVEVVIPEEILSSKFGFPSNAPADADLVADYGGRWVRLHIGPFLWQEMQAEAQSDVDFSKTDEYVKGYGEEGLGMLVTLWPFAEWDQKQHFNYERCRVSEEDIFVEPEPKFDDKDMKAIEAMKPSGALKVEIGEKPGKEGITEEMEIIFLPAYRCNPYNWDKYLLWVASVVERYDGDGVNDMPDLEIPIKYWEVMNEPDLEGVDYLDFYSDDADDYAELLIKTAEMVHKTDPEAQVLIAGAAGGNDGFLDFYRQVFENKAAREAFDIGNVHCISNDDFESYNVAPYQEMLAEFGIDRPIWITEAETLISYDVNINASQALASTKEALRLGAERIFYAHQKFELGLDKRAPDPKLKIPTYETMLNGYNSQAAFQIITQEN